MQISIVYATYSNSTSSAVEILSSELAARGHEPQILPAREATPEQLQKSDVVILASPSWDHSGHQGMPHEDYDEFIQKMQNCKLEGKKCAVMGLGDSNYTYFCGAVDHLEKLLNTMGGSLTLPSLRIDQFYVFEGESTVQIKNWAAQLVNTINKS